MKINITEKAKQQLENMLREQGQSAKKIRIMMTGIG
jgi:Fe-S cluster assembly iron-binding protein IscA